MYLETILLFHISFEIVRFMRENAKHSLNHSLQAAFYNLTSTG